MNTLIVLAALTAHCAFAPAGERLNVYAGDHESIALYADENGKRSELGSGRLASRDISAVGPIWICIEEDAPL